jgi:hypothetical protein
LGDLLPTVPALRTPRPDATIALVTWAETASLITQVDAWADERIGFPGYPDIRKRTHSRTLPRVLTQMRADRFDHAIQTYSDNPTANEVAIAALLTSGFPPSCGHPHDIATHLPHPLDLHERHRHFRLVGHLSVSTADASDAPQRPLANGDRPAAAGQQTASHYLNRGTVSEVNQTNQRGASTDHDAIFRAGRSAERPEVTCPQSPRYGLVLKPRRISRRMHEWVIAVPGLVAGTVGVVSVLAHGQ